VTTGGVNLTFVSGGTPYPEGKSWRRLRPYESELLERLLDSLEGERPVVPEFVRTADQCGCLEFEVTGPESPQRMVAEMALPRTHPGFPLEVLLFLRGNEVHWLEFERFDVGDQSVQTPAEDFKVIPQFDST
jgi:hypothetical protein